MAGDAIERADHRDVVGCPIGDDRIQHLVLGARVQIVDRRPQRVEPVDDNHDREAGHIGVGDAPPDFAGQASDQSGQPFALVQADNRAAPRRTLEHGEGVITPPVDRIEMTAAALGDCRRTEQQQRGGHPATRRADQQQVAVGSSPAQRQDALAVWIVDEADDSVRHSDFVHG